MKTLSQDARNPRHSRRRTESPGSEFSYEDDFERALDKSAEPRTSMNMKRNDNSGNVLPDDEVDADELFDVKMDELLRTKCDVTTDRLCRSVEDDEDTQLKQKCESLCESAVRKPMSMQLSNNLKPAGQVRLAVLPTAMTDALQYHPDSFVVDSRLSSSLPPLSVHGTTAVVTRKAIDHVDVDVKGSSSSSRTPELHVDDWQSRSGLVCCRLRSKSRSKSLPATSRNSLCGDNESSRAERQWKQRQLVIPADSRSTHCYRTLSSDDVDDDDRRVVTWRTLRTAIDDAMVELLDNFQTTARRVDGPQTSQLKRVDVSDLRRRVLRNLRSALWTNSEPADTTDVGDELPRLMNFVNSLLDSSDIDDLRGITGVKKYVMTCPLLQARCANDVVDWRQKYREQTGKDDREINVFVLRHGVKIDGLHVSVARRNGLPANSMQDSREYRPTCIIFMLFMEYFQL